MHSDKGTMLCHINTKSSCPINAIREFLTIYDSEISVLANIEFVQDYLVDNNIDTELYFNEIEAELQNEVKELILNYITTPEKAVEIIGLIEDKNLDPYYFELIDENSKYIHFLDNYDI